MRWSIIISAAFCVISANNLPDEWPEEHAEDSGCRIDAATFADFPSFAAKHRDDAVILGDLLQGLWEDTVLKNRSAFFDRYGSYELAVSDLNLAVFGRGGLATWRLREVAASFRNAANQSGAPLDAVWFVETHHPLSMALREELQAAGGVPPLLAPMTHTGPAFSLGARGAAGHFNRHEENWFAQLWGRKRWHLLPPTAELPAATAAAQPCKYPASLGSVCITRPGDVLFLGTNWWHATCNLDEAAGVVYIGARDGMSLTRTAALDGDLKTIEAALSDGKGLNEELAGDAAHAGHVAVLALLRRHGVDLAGELSSEPPLHKAARAGHATVVSFLLEAGIRPSLVAGAGDGKLTALHSAAAGCSPEVAQILLAAGADARVLDANGATPAHLSVRMGCIDVLAKLGEAGSTSTVDSRGRLPLHSAAINGHTNAIEHLLAGTAGKHCPADDTGCEPLHHAALGGHASCVAALLSGCEDGLGSLGRGCGTSGMGPLALVALSGSTDALTLLMTARADVEVTDGRGRSALHHAAAAGHVEVSAALLDLAGRDALVGQDVDGHTPAELAEAEGNTAVSMILRWHARLAESAGLGAAKAEL